MYQRVKGMNDLINKDGKKFISLAMKLHQLMDFFGFSYIQTPLLENYQVFHRENDFSDIVLKETYDFTDKGGRLLTLRPEATAAVVRAYVENKMYAQIEPQKLYYFGPFYRYERPQKGRFREFHQFGIEVFCSSNPFVDADIINIAYNIFKEIGLAIIIKINSLGDSESRSNYKTAIIDYFNSYLNLLCTDCQNRLKTNALRILDCKICYKNEWFKVAPVPIDFLSEQSRIRFDLVKTYLKIANIPHIIDRKLVRGLDYYEDTVFEIVLKSNIDERASVLGGGGAYPYLVKQLGGPDTYGFGFACGIERILLALEDEQSDTITQDLDVFIIYFGDTTTLKALEILTVLRENNFKVNINYVANSFKPQFRQAIKENAKFIILIGDDEVSNKELTIKNAKTAEQLTMKEENLITYLKECI